jgi:hypothetical protein
MIEGLFRIGVLSAYWLFGAFIDARDARLARRLLVARGQLRPLTRGSSVNITGDIGDQSPHFSWSIRLPTAQDISREERGRS